MRLKNSSTMKIWENRNNFGNPKIKKKSERNTYTKRKDDAKKMSIMQTHTDQPIIRHGGMRILDITFDSVVFISFVTVFLELVVFFFLFPILRYCKNSKQTWNVHISKEMHVLIKIFFLNCKWVHKLVQEIIINYWK